MGIPRQKSIIISRVLLYQVYILSRTIYGILKLYRSKQHIIITEFYGDRQQHCLLQNYWVDTFRELLDFATDVLYIINVDIMWIY